MGDKDREQTIKYVRISICSVAFYPTCRFQPKSSVLNPACKPIRNRKSNSTVTEWTLLQTIRVKASEQVHPSSIRLSREINPILLSPCQNIDFIFLRGRAKGKKFSRIIWIASLGNNWLGKFESMPSEVCGWDHTGIGLSTSLPLDRTAGQESLLSHGIVSRYPRNEILDIRKVNFAQAFNLSYCWCYLSWNLSHRSSSGWKFNTLFLLLSSWKTDWSFLD